MAGVRLPPSLLRTSTNEEIVALLVVVDGTTVFSRFRRPDGFQPISTARRFSADFDGTTVSAEFDGPTGLSRFRRPDVLQPIRRPDGIQPTSTARRFQPSSTARRVSAELSTRN
jgi:hypothetical protein